MAERRRVKMRPLPKIGQGSSAPPLGSAGGVEDRGGPIDYVCGSCENVLLPGREVEPPGLRVLPCFVCGGYSEIGPPDTT
jgi:hypothetical protein